MPKWLKWVLLWIVFINTLGFLAGLSGIFS